MEKRKASLSELSRLINSSFKGEDVIINGLNLCNRKTTFQSVLCYSTSEQFDSAILNNIAIKALVVTPELYEHLINTLPKERNLSFILSKTPEQTFYELFITLVETGLFYDDFSFKSIIGNNCLIADNAVIEDGVIIGDNVKIGKNCIIKSGSILNDNVYIGDGSIIGNISFQAIKDNDGHYMKIPHVGQVVLSENVQVGCNVTICRSLFEGYTKIGQYSILEDMSHVGHNCEIGSDCMIGAGVIMFGSSSLENNVWVSPGVCVNNKVVIGEGAFVGASSFVIQNVEQGSRAFGNPARKIPTMKM